MSTARTAHIHKKNRKEPEIELCTHCIGETHTHPYSRDVIFKHYLFVYSSKYDDSRIRNTTCWFLSTQNLTKNTLVLLRVSLFCAVRFIFACFVLIQQKRCNTRNTPYRKMNECGMQRNLAVRYFKSRNFVSSQRTLAFGKSEAPQIRYIYHCSFFCSLSLFQFRVTLAMGFCCFFNQMNSLASHGWFSTKKSFDSRNIQSEKVSRAEEPGGRWDRNACKFVSRIGFHGKKFAQNFHSIPTRLYKNCVFL